MFRGPQEIDAALSHLGKRLLYADVPPVSIVVCGGNLPLATLRSLLAR